MQRNIQSRGDEFKAVQAAADKKEQAHRTHTYKPPHHSEQRHSFQSFKRWVSTKRSKHLGKAQNTTWRNFSVDSAKENSATKQDYRAKNSIILSFFLHF